LSQQCRRGFGGRGSEKIEVHVRVGADQTVAHANKAGPKNFRVDIAGYRR
jgi:hypothetical protein